MGDWRCGPGRVGGVRPGRCSDDGGQQDCAADETPITQLKAPDGDLSTVAPGANSQVYHGYYPFWGTVRSASSGAGGDWQATVDSADPRLSSRETYAACVS